MIRRNWNANDTQRSAENEAESMPQGMLQAPRGHPAGHVHKWGVTADCIGSRLTLPKSHLAT